LFGSGKKLKGEIDVDVDVDADGKGKGGLKTSARGKAPLARTKSGDVGADASFTRTKSKGDVITIEGGIKGEEKTKKAGLAATLKGKFIGSGEGSVEVKVKGGGKKEKEEKGGVEVDVDVEVKGKGKGKGGGLLSPRKKK